MIEKRAFELKMRRLAEEEGKRVCKSLVIYPRGLQAYESFYRGAIEARKESQKEIDEVNAKLKATRDFLCGEDDERN